MTVGIKLIDTNILIYAYYEAQDAGKQQTCFRLIEGCFQGEGQLAVTNQILAEFVNVATTKLKPPLEQERVENLLRRIAEYRGFVKLVYAEQTVIEANRLTRAYGISFWDALIAATMTENRVYTIYTENEKDFSKIPGLKVINPLKS